MNTNIALENTTTAKQDSQNHLLQVALDAMLDALTVEQQTKMAAYLLRKRSEALSRGGDRALATA